MSEDSYSLNDLADTTGIEARTIRSYRTWPPARSADAWSRSDILKGSSLGRLQVIISLRRARPNISLSEIRVVLQGLNPLQIHGLANGSIMAATRAMDESMQPEGADSEEVGRKEETEIPTAIEWERFAAELTGTERLVCLLRDVSRLTPTVPTSKVEGCNEPQLRRMWNFLFVPILTRTN